MTQGAGASIVGTGGYRRWLFVGGVLLSLVSCVYLAVYIHDHWSELPPLELTGRVGVWLFAGCILYFVSLLTTASGWFYAVRALGCAMEARVAIGLTLAAQIGKYAPGNIAHHLGRAALANNRGLSLPAAAKASVMEVGMAVVAGGIVAAAGAAFSPAIWDFAAAMPPDRRQLTAAALVIGAVVIAGSVAWLSRNRLQRPWMQPELLAGSLRMLACYGLSFLFAGISYWAVARAFGQSIDVAFCVAVYALAWVLGFVTPGAPAGLGVREYVLVLATTPALGPAAISVAIVHRLATAFADAIGAGAGAFTLLPRKAAHHGH